jgi:hypothetical protein
MNRCQHFETSRAKISAGLQFAQGRIDQFLPDISYLLHDILFFVGPADLLGELPLFPGRDQAIGEGKVLVSFAESRPVDLPDVFLDVEMLPFVFHPLHELLEALLAADFGKPEVSPNFKLLAGWIQGDNNREKSQT